MAFFLGIVFKSRGTGELNKIMKSFAASLLAIGATAVTLESEYCAACEAAKGGKPIVTIQANELDGMGFVQSMKAYSDWSLRPLA